MRKSHVLLFLALLVFWFSMSLDWDYEHLLIGVVLAMFMAWYWREIANIMPTRSLRFVTLIGFVQYLFLLSWEILLSNLRVVTNVLFGRPSLDPGFVHFCPPLKTNWGRVLLANSITLTPGTVTIDVNPDNGEFMVHGLTSGFRDEVSTSRLIAAIQKLESTRGEN